MWLTVNHPELTVPHETLIIGWSPSIFQPMKVSRWTNGSDLEGLSISPMSLRFWTPGGKSLFLTAPTIDFTFCPSQESQQTPYMMVTLFPLNIQILTDCTASWSMLLAYILQTTDSSSPLIGMEGDGSKLVIDGQKFGW